MTIEGRSTGQALRRDSRWSVPLLRNPGVFRIIPIPTAWASEAGHFRRYFAKHHPADVVREAEVVVRFHSRLHRAARRHLARHVGIRRGFRTECRFGHIDWFTPHVLKMPQSRANERPFNAAPLPAGRRSGLPARRGSHRLPPRILVVCQLLPAPHGMA